MYIDTCIKVLLVQKVLRPLRTTLGQSFDFHKTYIFLYRYTQYKYIIIMYARARSVNKNQTSYLTVSRARVVCEFRAAYAFPIFSRSAYIISGVGGSLVREHKSRRIIYTSKACFTVIVKKRVVLMCQSDVVREYFHIHLHSQRCYRNKLKNTCTKIINRYCQES